MVWCGVVWYGMACHGMVGMVYGVVWYGMAWHGIPESQKDVRAEYDALYLN